MTGKTRLWTFAALGAFLLLGFLATPSVAVAQNQITDGDFEVVTFPPTNWIARNQSAVIGTNTQCWNRFTTTPWAPHGGVGHSGANFNCSSGANDISGWLLSNRMTNLQNGQTMTFWTRKASPDSFPDRLEVRLCTDTTPDSCGAAGSTGSTSSDVGSYTTLLVSVNPTLVTGVYPTVYTQFSVVLSGLSGVQSGRLGFRYFVTNGGPSGANSDIMSIDDVVVTPVELMAFEVD